jgi:heme exporter protein D
MDSLAAFLQMGGYAAYVWPALGIAAAVMIGLLAQSLHSLRAREATLAVLKRELVRQGQAAEDVQE